MTQLRVTLEDHMGSDETVVRAAKVSFDNDNVGTKEEQARLIKYLVRGMTREEYDALLDLARVDPATALWKFRSTPIHAAPFGHCFLSFTIHAPVYVARHLVKHEYLRMSEVSRRYVKGKPEYYIPDQWHEAVASVKQGGGRALGEYADMDATAEWLNAVEAADAAYNELLKMVSPEEARIVLLLCHMTRWRWSGSLDAFMNMCKMRIDDHVQHDTRKVAEMIGREIKAMFPQSWASYVDGDI